MTGELIIRIHVVMLIWNVVAFYRYVEVDGRWGWGYLGPMLAAQSIFFLIFGTGLTYVCE